MSVSMLLPKPGMPALPIATNRNTRSANRSDRSPAPASRLAAGPRQRCTEELPKLFFSLIIPWQSSWATAAVWFRWGRNGHDDYRPHFLSTVRDQSGNLLPIARDVGRPG